MRRGHKSSSKAAGKRKREGGGREKAEEEGGGAGGASKCGRSSRRGTWSWTPTAGLVGGQPWITVGHTENFTCPGPALST